MSDLYDADILVWSEQQAAQLRRFAVSERLNADSPDWPNIIEEIESVGREQLHSMEALLVQALVHMLKAEGWKLARDVESWRADARRFRDDAASRFSPSMRQRIDLAKLYARALRGLPRMMDDQPPSALPAECPVTLDELLSDD